MSNHANQPAANANQPALSSLLDDILDATLAQVPQVPQPAPAPVVAVTPAPAPVVAVTPAPVAQVAPVAPVAPVTSPTRYVPAAKALTCHKRGGFSALKYHTDCGQYGVDKDTTGAWFALSRDGTTSPRYALKRDLLRSLAGLSTSQGPIGVGQVPQVPQQVAAAAPIPDQYANLPSMQALPTVKPMRLSSGTWGAKASQPLKVGDRVMVETSGYRGREVKRFERTVTDISYANNRGEYVVSFDGSPAIARAGKRAHVCPGNNNCRNYGWLPGTPTCKRR